MTLKELESLLQTLEPAKGTAFVKAVRAASHEPDVNKLQLLSFLDRTITEFSAEGRRICTETRDITLEDRENLTLYGRIIAAALIILQKTRSVKDLREKTLLFMEYASALVRTKYNFLTAALDVVNYPITAVGLDWKLVEDATSLDILSYKLIEGIVFDRSRMEPFVFTGKGKVFCRDGVLSVCSSEAEESGSQAFTVCSDHVRVITRNVRDEKLKASDQFDAAALALFSENFCRSQEEFSRTRAQKRQYNEGEKVDIRITSLSADGEWFLAEVAERDSQVSGAINHEELIKGVYTEDIMPFLFESDCIRGAVLQKDRQGWYFSIKEAYGAYARSRAEKDYRANLVFEARLVAEREEWGRLIWMSPSGYCGITLKSDFPDAKIDDSAVMQVLNIQNRYGEIYINFGSPRYDSDSVQRLGTDEDMLAGFILSPEELSVQAAKSQPQEDQRERDTIVVLSSILLSTARRGSSIDAYRHLLVALFLARAVDDAAAEKTVSNEAFFLSRALCFAQGGRVSSAIREGLTDDEKGVLRLLSRWEDDTIDLTGEAAAFPKGSRAGDIYSLLLGLQIACRFQDEVKADREQVRRRICDILGVKDSYEAGEGGRKGKYGRTEGQEVEFKSSYVFRNDNGRPDIDYQGRGQVFEAVCAFLNADGGTLYLGVNDSGEPIVSEEYGLNADMRWLSANHKLINGQRSRQLGHAVPKADNLDHFVLFLNSEKELYFKESLQGNITIEVTPDADAICFHVRPAEYEIAYLFPDKQRRDGVAYVRDGGRTIPMSTVQKERRLMSLKRITKEMGFVVTIQDAINQHRKLIFKDYASGNSGVVKDRFVVPVNLFYNDENVYCYDLEARKYKQFRLHRISTIETEMDNPVYTLPLTAPKQADVFRWLDEGVESYHIRLRLEVAAKNYLFEEYSCAEKLPGEQLFKEADDTWILDTRVNGLGAVRRFYLGLADKIEILDSEDSEELKASIRQFIEDNILKG